MPFRSLLVVTLALGAMALMSGAPAEACCTPCRNICDTAPPEAYCCSGIPEPGNICGFMTCGEYTGGGGPSTELTQPFWTVVDAEGACDTVAAETPAQEADEAVEPKERAAS